jgi:hypothetical protein
MIESSLAFVEFTFDDKNGLRWKVENLDPVDCVIFRSSQHYKLQNGLQNRNQTWEIIGGLKAGAHMETFHGCLDSTLLQWVDNPLLEDTPVAERFNPEEVN